MGQSREGRPIVLSRSWIGGCSYRLELDFGPEWECPGLGPSFPTSVACRRTPRCADCTRPRQPANHRAHGADSATVAEGCQSGHEPACAPGGSPVQPVICSC